MKKIIIIFVLFICTLLTDSCSTNNKNEINIIPHPLEIISGDGIFTLDQSTIIFSDLEFKKYERVSRYLMDIINKSSGIKLEYSNKLPEANFIHLKYDAKIENSEGYTFESSDQNILISASNEEGLFYGVQTLLQLLPPQVFSNKQQNFRLTVPAVRIVDQPRFKWRGGHLDVGRHFYAVDEIKKYIDYLALHKFNVFHWHLTEDQGWRIEIKKYPKLTSIGAYRNETMGDGQKYGGFYTQEVIKEIVSYAQDRFITVIPEIELPGHSQAAISAYPELSCNGKPIEAATTWGVFDDVYCAGNEQTFKFLEDVFDEVIPLFPSEYIHIGGDECPKIRWEKCPKCQARIKKENLKNEHELQSYFIQRIEKFLASKGKKIIGWDEILEGGLAPQATVMSWRGEAGGIEAAKQKHDVIMTPGEYCYFNHHQGDPSNESQVFGERLTLTRVYSYEPIPSELKGDEINYVLGAQANLWSERLPQFKDVEYMLMPRLSAMSEVLWSLKEKRDFKDFLKRMEAQFDRYDNLEINYAKSAYNVSIRTKFNDTTMTLNAEMYTEIGNTEIYYTLDGSEPNNKSNLYSKPIEIGEKTVIKAVSYKNNNLMSKVSSLTILTHLAYGKSVELKFPYAEKYSSDGKYSLVNGLFGTSSHQDSYWQGFEHDDFEALVDLGAFTEINSVETGFLQNNHSWIFQPEYVQYSFSSDGKNFSDPIIIKNDIDPKDGKLIIKRYKADKNVKDIRFIKIFAKNISVCPDWHMSAGGKAWLFVDEIFVN